MRLRICEVAFSCQTWSLKFNGIFQNVGGVRGMGENLVAREFRQRIIRWVEWDKGTFRVVQVENELEEPLDRFWR